MKVFIIYSKDGLFERGSVYLLDSLDSGLVPGVTDYCGKRVSTEQDGMEMLFSNNFLMPDGETVGFYSYGDIPVPEADKEKDKIIVVSDDRMPTLRLFKIDFYGYGAPAYKYYNSATYEMFDNFYHELPDLTLADNVTIFDDSGAELADWHNLEKGSICYAKWYEGTQGNEKPLKADCRVYVHPLGYPLVHGALEFDYEIEATMTDEGYVEYDIQGVSAGLYRITDDLGSSRGVVRIK